MQLTHILKYLDVLISVVLFQNIYLLLKSPSLIIREGKLKQADFGSHASLQDWWLGQMKLVQQSAT